MNADGTNAELFLNGFHSGLTYSYDGRWMAFVAGGCHEDAAPGLWMARPDGRDARCVLTLGGRSSDFAWSADGETLYYAGATATDSVPALYAVPIGPGGMIERLEYPKGQITGVDVTRSGAVMISLYHAGTPGDDATEVWMLPPPAAPDSVTPPIDAAGVAAVDLEPGEVPAGRVNATLLDLVLRAEEAAPALRGLWPGFWDGTQTYALRLPGRLAEALIVTPGPTPAGFAPVAAAELPPGLGGRLYHARGVSADIGDIFYDIPVVVVSDTFPHSSPVPSALENRLFQLYGAVFLDPDAGLLDLSARRLDRSEGRAGAQRSCRSGCPTRDSLSCEAWLQMEARILSAGAAGTFAAVHWLHVHDSPREIWSERRLGLSAYVARRAAMLAVGRDTAAYSPDWSRGPSRRAELARNSPERRRAEVKGQQIAMLLDRFGTDWRADVRSGAPLPDALFNATGMTRRGSLAAGIEAMDEYGFEWMFRDGRSIYVKGPPHEGFYMSALCALGPPVTAIGIDIPTTHVIDAGRFTLRWLPGPNGVASPEKGDVFLADPEKVELTIGDSRIVVRGRPVGIVQGPGSFEGTTRIMIYPSAELADEIRDQEGTGQAAVQHVRGGGVEMWIGPEMRVFRRSGVIVITPVPAP